ncbi:MAG: response regulator transcription factor [Anaerolineae bacterium]|nr:response regulator transcription factor [Anaerolineae bacterium]
MSKLRILIADDHAIVREGLAAILAVQPDMELAGAAADGVEAISLAQSLHPDVILLDLVMPRKDGVQAIIAIKQAMPHAHILVLTSFADDEKVFPAIKAGALGYLLKDTPREQLLQAIRDVAKGRAYLHPAIALKMMRELGSPSELPPTTDPLTERELETLRFIARGLSNQEIAAAMGIHERTVAKYISSILDKLHLANRTQAALYALRQGLAELESGHF